MFVVKADRVNCKRGGIVRCVIGIILTVSFVGIGLPLLAHETHQGDISVTGGYEKNERGANVIVFVHGLFSGPEAWRCDPTHYWPEMIAKDTDPSFVGTDVYVLKYPTPTRHGKMTMTDLGTFIVNQLETEHVFSNHRNVIFVAHSMGGILIQQILLTYREFSKQVPTLFLYGTPQEGSHLANLGRYFNSDPLLRELESGDNNFILHEMDQRWIHAGFSNIRRYCAYETQPESGLKVVNRDSATRGCDDNLAVDVNHRDLVKPCDTGKPSYTFVKNKLNLIRNSGTAPTERPAPSQAGPNVRNPATSPFVDRQTPYGESQQVLDALSNLTTQWSQMLYMIQVEAARPYKYDHKPGPMPAKLPDELIDRLADQEREVVSQYESNGVRITRVRQEALDCMRLTPNQKAEDDGRFDQANRAATRLTPPSKFVSTGPEGDRFTAIRTYFTDLHRKLGDLRCGMD